MPGPFFMEQGLIITRYMLYLQRKLQRKFRKIVATYIQFSKMTKMRIFRLRYCKTYFIFLSYFQLRKCRFYTYARSYPLYPQKSG